MALTNVTNTSSNPAALNSTHAPTTRGLMTKTTTSIPVNAGKGSSAPITPTKDENNVSGKPESTKPVVRVVSSPANRIDDGGNEYTVVLLQKISRPISQMIAENSWVHETKKY